MEKKRRTIRINEDLYQVLSDVPKGISYANWILDKIQRLDAHEQNPVCWVVSTSNVGPNRMSVDDENGSHPIFDEVIEIVNKRPLTNMSHEEREEGWLGQTNDYSSSAHGGFASIEAARTYIKDYLEGRFIEDEDLLNEGSLSDDNELGELYTTAEFNKYYFVGDWFDSEFPNVEGLNDEQIEALAEKEIKEAEKQGIGLLGNIEVFLKDLQK